MKQKPSPLSSPSLPPCGGASPARPPALAVALFAASAALAAAPTVFVNEDNQHFYERPDEEMSVAGCQALVDFYADAGGVKGMLFCVNLQRALYDSDVWERFRDIEGESRYLNGLRLLSARKVDNFAVWLDRARARGLEAWLTMRMNDSHGLKEAAQGMPSRLAKWHTKMWEAHPEWRRAPYRPERSWEGSYDYAVPEVYAHHLALVREIFAKWGDRMDGLELDWLRWGFFFRPGFEVEGRAVLTRFVRDVRALADEAERRTGRRIRLAHRVPTNPESALNCGFDVAAWKRAGCVDMLTLSLFCGGNDFSLPVDVWRGLVGDGTWINYCVSDETSTRPGWRTGSGSYGAKALFYGGAAAAFARGADGVYTFNECYLYSNPKGRGRELLKAYLPVVGDPDALARVPRRFATSSSNMIPGEPTRGVLPIPLKLPFMGMDMGRMEENVTVRLDAGKVLPGSRVRLELAFDAATDPARLGRPEVRVNTARVPCTGAGTVDASRVDPKNDWQIFADWPRDAGCYLVYDVPAEVLHPTFNAVELMPPQIPGALVWASLSVTPPAARQTR